MTKSYNKDQRIAICSEQDNLFVSPEVYCGPEHAIYQPHADLPLKTEVSKIAQPYHAGVLLKLIHPLQTNVGQEVAIPQFQQLAHIYEEPSTSYTLRQSK